MIQLLPRRFGSISLVRSRIPNASCSTLCYPQVGVGLSVLDPGEPMAMYHWETDQEDFLVLSGEPLLIVEGEER